MKGIQKIILGIFALGLLWPTGALAAGISASGGGKYNVGATFTVTVKASGATFDSLQGTISVSGPVQVVSFSGGGATWLPGKSPANGAQFVGIVSPTSSLTVATIKLKGTKEGSGSVSVSGVKLARSGAYVGSDGGGTSFTITRAPTPPGAVTVTSSTHPDPSVSYEATTVQLAWNKPAGVTGFAYGLNQEAETVPAATVTSAETAFSYTDLAIGTHYFHIRALNADGWGGTTHFKITIKEPDPKVDDTLSAPTITTVERATTFTSNVENGTLTGVRVAGRGGLAEYQVKLAITPPERIPAEVVLTTTPAADGSWEVVIDKPIPAGFYQVTAQSQKDKILTPVSAVTKFEVGIADGGRVEVITDQDAFVPAPPESAKVLGLKMTKTTLGAFMGLTMLLLLGLAGTFFYFLYWKHRSKRVLPLG